MPLESRVPLKSGTPLVIEQTEASYQHDVNTRSHVGVQWDSSYARQIYITK